jgi:glycosyltransferase involved in cell wall biosynthesis
MSAKVAPLISIITPTYNHEDFIAPCIQSVLDQTYPHWEQIIVDDGSTDETGRVIANFVQQDARIRYIRQENQGLGRLAQTYNTALEVSKGDLVAILEGDDLWPVWKLSDSVAAFEDWDVVLSHGIVSDLSSDGTVALGRTSIDKLRNTLSSDVLSNNPVGRILTATLNAKGIALVAPATVVIRKTALESIGGFQFVPGLPLTDYPTFLRLALVGRFSSGDGV